MYTSIKIDYIGSCLPASSEGEYLRSVKINNIWIDYDHYGNWVILNYIGMVEKVLTEKTNALLYFALKKYNYEPIKLYNISKFLLLSHIVDTHLVHDILTIIISMSD